MNTYRYNYQLCPSVEVERALLDEWHCCRWVWNQLVTAHKQCRRFFTSADLAVARVRYEWLRAGSQNAQVQMAYEFCGKGRRNVKPKRDLPNIPYTTRGFPIRNGRLQGWLAAS